MDTAAADDLLSRLRLQVNQERATAQAVACDGLDPLAQEMHDLTHILGTQPGLFDNEELEDGGGDLLYELGLAVDIEGIDESAEGSDGGAGPSDPPLHLGSKLTSQQTAYA
eukprot:257789-Chlamydomonas_euryale.AAC.1